MPVFEMFGGTNYIGRPLFVLSMKVLACMAKIGYFFSPSPHSFFVSVELVCWRVSRLNRQRQKKQVKNYLLLERINVGTDFCN